MRKITKRTATIVATAALGVGALGATAWATGWFDSTATASVTTASAGVVTGSVSITTDLYPTATGNVTIKLTNPNKYKVKITGIQIANPTTISGGCKGYNAGITFDNPNLVLAAAPTTGPAVEKTFNLTGLAHMSADADNACAGVTATGVAVVLTGAVTTAEPTSV